MNDDTKTKRDQRLQVDKIMSYEKQDVIIVII